MLRGTAGVFVVGGVGQAFIFGVQAVLARMAGADEFGIYVYVFTWFNIVLIAALAGLDTATIKFVSVYVGTQRWSLGRGAIRFSRSAAALISIGVAALLAVAVSLLPMQSGLRNAFYVACVLLPLWALARVNNGVLEGLKRVVVANALFAVARPLLWLTTALVLVAVLGITLTGAGLVLAHALAVALTLGVIYWLILRVQPDELRSATPEIRASEWFGTSLPLSFVAGMSLVLNRVDIVLVGILLGTTEAGIYAVASRAAQIVNLGLSASNKVVAPRVAELYATNQIERLQRVVSPLAGSRWLRLSSWPWLR